MLRRKSGHILGVLEALLPDAAVGAPAVGDHSPGVAGGGALAAKGHRRRQDAVRGEGAGNGRRRFGQQQTQVEGAALLGLETGEGRPGQEALGRRYVAPLINSIMWSAIHPMPSNPAIGLQPP